MQSTKTIMEIQLRKQLYVTESDIQQALNNHFRHEEELLTHVEMNKAAEAGLFNVKDEMALMEVDHKPVVVKAAATDIYHH